MSFTTLVSAEQLRELLRTDAPPVLIDTSFDLADTAAGERSYREGHLPGAHYLHLDRDLSAPKTGRNGRHPLPAREAFSARIGSLGVTPATQAVVYDRQQGMYAARAWWMLRWLGHEAVALLDGGVAAWTAGGGPLETALPVARPAAPYPTREPLVSTLKSPGAAGAGAHPGVTRTRPCSVGEDHFLGRGGVKPQGENRYHDFFRARPRRGARASAAATRRARRTSRLGGRR